MNDHFTTTSPLVTSLAAVILIATACDRAEDIVEPPPLPDEAEVFGDAFATGVDFQAFGDSKLDALQTDAVGGLNGTAGLKVTVPAEGDPSGAYAGGAIVASIPRDLTSYNAISFWARSSSPATLDVSGIGNDNTGTSIYTAEVVGLPLTTGWRKYSLPFPLPSVLTREAGLFYFAEGPEEGQGNEIWLDDIRFENLSSVTNPRPEIASATIAGEVGASHAVTGLSVTFGVDGADVMVSAMPSYFTFSSSEPSVATVNDHGLVSFVGEGATTVTASLGSTPASGTVAVTVAAPPVQGPPAPERDAADVISLFSGSYDDHPVDSWSTDWDQADVEDVDIAGNAAKRYSSLIFAGIEFASQTVDATAMTGLHLDVWLTDPREFKVKLVDFGADGAFGGGDDTEHEVTLGEGGDPSVGKGAWNSLDLPLFAFTGLTSRAHLAQLIISGTSPIAYVDNVYFYSEEVVEPSQPAPTPTAAAGDVISFFSDAYDDVQVDTWSAEWDQADVSDVEVQGNATKRYSSLVFAGIEFVSSTIDADSMTHFHMDIWTPDPTDEPAAFKVKLVDFGTDGVWGGAGSDDVEHEIAFTRASEPSLVSRGWISLDIPLADFTGLATRAHLAQLIISGDPNTVFVDNIYLRR